MDKYDSKSEQHANDIIAWISEYVVPFVAPRESVERGEIQIRYRELPEKEYNDAIEADEKAKRGQLPYA